MTTLALVALLCVGASFSSPALAQEPPDRAGLKSAATTATPRSLVPTHYEIDVAFEPERSFLRATAKVTLRVTEKTDAIEFELNRYLTLHSVTDSAGRALEFIRSGRLNSHKLLVRLGEPAHAESELKLTFAYGGALPPGSLDYITADGILLRDESRWYPATDLAAFTQSDITLRLPPQWEGVTTGSFNDLETNAWVRWKTESPLSGRPVFAYRRSLVCLPKSGNNLWSHPDEDYKPHIGFCRGWDQPDSAFSKMRRKAGEIFPAYGELLGEFDGDWFSMMEGFPGQQGVMGYSAPGLLVLSKDSVKWHDYPGFAPSFLPHEVAHQWFPIEVTLASEEDGWLAESLAEYLAWRYLAEKQPDDARGMVEIAMRNTLAFEPVRPLRLGLKLFALEDWEVTRATLYQRGMLVWRTLETVIDRERVDRALREYYKRHRGGPASIADFRKICEEISGRDLGWFFDYYLNGTELPEVSLRRLPSSAPNELAGEIIVRNAPPDFQVRVEMRIATAGGVIDHSVATRGQVTPFAIDVRDRVTGVTLDPNLRILRLTEAARRHRAQRARLEQSGNIEWSSASPEMLHALVRDFEDALSLDPENLAGNQQVYSLQLGRMQLRLKDYDAAWQSLERVLALESLDPMATDLHRAWARVFRARIALVRGDKATARKEAEAGLAKKCPALETRVSWPGEPDEQSAADALAKLLADL